MPTGTGRGEYVSRVAGPAGRLGMSRPGWSAARGSGSLTVARWRANRMRLIPAHTTASSYNRIFHEGLQR
jgi:hypothetical protein